MASSKHPKAPSAEELAARNPKIDLDFYREVMKLLDDLRETGVEPKGYDLRSPYDPRALDHLPRTHEPLRSETDDLVTS